MIAVRNLKVSYPTGQALANVSLSINTGEWVLVTGPSGCGKSTLARVLTGLIPNSIPGDVTGELSVAGKDPRECSVAEMSQQIGMVFQNPSSQLFHLKVYDEIAFGLRNQGLNKEEISARVDWALEAANLLDLADSLPAVLSGGQKQCVAIAAVLAMRPEIILLDEPTASLDDASVQRVMSTLEDLRAKYGITIVMIEHKLTAAMKHADRLVVMNSGRVAADMTIEEAFQQPDLVSGLGLRRFTQEEPTPWRKMIRTNGKQSSGEPLLSLQGVHAGYQGHEVIREINFEIYPGEFAALVGPNGAGKSTIGMVAAGLLKPSQGKVSFLGRGKPRPGLDVNLLFQNPIDQLFTECVDEELAFGPLNYGNFDLEQHKITLEQADLMAIRERSPLTLSVGQQHRTALGACVAMRPKLVILDEPTLGQDWVHLQQLMNFLRRLNENGTAVLLISHDFKLVYRYARRVILLEAGRIKMEGSLGQRKQPRLEKEQNYEANYA